MSKTLRDQLLPEKETGLTSGVQSRLKASLFTFLFAICLMAFSQSANAQSKIAVTSISKDAATTWHVLKETTGITISYQYVDCGPVEFILFKVDNPSNAKVSVSWKYQFLNKGEELPLHPDNAIAQFELNARTNLVGKCLGESDAKLNVFVKEKGNAFRLTDIKLMDVKVTALQ